MFDDDLLYERKRRHSESLRILTSTAPVPLPACKHMGAVTSAGCCGKRWYVQCDFYGVAVDRSKCDTCGGKPPAKGSGHDLVLMSLEDGKHHTELYDQLAGIFSASGWVVRREKALAQEPKWALEKLCATGPKPDVVVKWEEHGGLMTNRQWRDACPWLYDQGIMPAQIDWGYFDHYRTVQYDWYTRKGGVSLPVVWSELAEEPAWGLAASSIREYRDKKLEDWAKAEELGPVDGTEPGYVLVYLQYSANGNILPAKSYPEWVEHADTVFKDADIPSVWKCAPVKGKAEPPHGAVAFGHRAKHECLNMRLLRFARHAVVITSTVSNEALIVGAPVVSCGPTWTRGLNVWAVPEHWADIAKTPTIDERTRGKYASFCILRSAAKAETPALLLRLLEQWRLRFPAGTAAPTAKLEAEAKPEPDRAIYLVGRGLGNLMMAVPAIKALSEHTGKRVEVAGAKSMYGDFLKLIERERWVKSAVKAIPKDATGAFVTGAALIYPRQLADKHHSATAAKLDAAEDRLMSVHETEQDAIGLRRDGYAEPLPFARIHADAPPADLPPRYVAVGMECATKWVQGRNRLWPHWQAFARQWKERSAVPLVFLGLNRQAWVNECGIDKIGETTLGEAAAIINGADVFVGVDCGLSHVAGALAVPSLVLYGPTTSYHTGPAYASLSSVDGRHSCRACFGTADWANCRSPKCMASIHPTRVVDALVRLLWRRGEPLRRETAREKSRGRWYHSKHRNVKPAQRPQELEALWPMLTEVQAETVLEIGVKRGGWLYVMAPTFRYGAHLIGVELDTRKLKANGFERWLTTEGYRVSVVEGDSRRQSTVDAVKSVLNGKPVDILHIDGDHELESVLADWSNYKPLVRPGGMVVMHDAFKHNADVPQAIEQIKNAERERVYRWHWIQAFIPHWPGDGIAVAEL